MPDLSDKELETLLHTLTPPAPPSGLSARIVAALPEQPLHWTKRLAQFFGTETLLLPTGGALASLFVGILAGYLIVPQPVTIDETTDIYVAEVFGSDPWDAFDTDILQ